MRVVGLDLGVRRIGIAISDPTRTLARPVGSVPTRSVEGGVHPVADEIARLVVAGDPVSLVVIGLPRRLDGSPNEMTARATAFAGALSRLTGLPVHLQDERLTSREAESRLALTDRNWRSRKARLDAAAAAIILQEYLDAHRFEVEALEPSR